MKLKSYIIIERAIEEGMGFARHRLNDKLEAYCYPKILDDIWEEAKESMVNEIMLKLDEVIKWEELE